MTAILTNLEQVMLTLYNLGKVHSNSQVAAQASWSDMAIRWRRALASRLACHSRGYASGLPVVMAMMSINQLHIFPW